MPASQPIAPEQDVTVVMPAKNRSRLIRRALGSVASQTRPPYELIVVDDGSTDDTAEVARSLGATVIVKATSEGSGSARNTGIEAASTPWIAFLDSDDEWLPSHLETVTGAITDQVMMSACATDTGDRWRGTPTGRPVPLTSARCFVPDTLVVTSTVLASREALIAAGLFRTLPRAQDLDMWARLLEHGTGTTLPIATALYHEHGEQASVDEDLMRRCVNQILADYSGRPWMTSRVVEGTLGRIAWDQMRAAEREKRYADALRHATWLATHPAGARCVLELLSLRNQGRRLTRGRKDRRHRLTRNSPPS